MEVEPGPQGRSSECLLEEAEAVAVVTQLADKGDEVLREPGEPVEA